MKLLFHSSKFISSSLFCDSLQSLAHQAEVLIASSVGQDIDSLLVVSKNAITTIFSLYLDAKKEKLCQLSPECDTVALELEVTVTCKQKASSKPKQYIPSI